MTETEIVHTALDYLKHTVPDLQMQWKPFRKTDADGQLKVSVPGKTVTLVVEVKREVKTSTLPRLLEQAALHEPFMVIAMYIHPKAKETLRHSHIAYLEANGNFYLAAGDVFFFIDTAKPVATKRNTTGTASFTEAETRLLYHLLLDESLLGCTYREIALKTATALGGITPLFKRLHSLHYLSRQKGSSPRFISKKELLAHWVKSYEEKLQPRSLTGRFRFVQKDDFRHWKTLKLQEGKSWWGSEPAADLLTRYLQPGELTLYSREERLALMRTYRVAPDPAGPLFIRKPFWPKSADAPGPMVPPLLVYADLLITGDPRCIETAQKIYDQFLTPVLG